VLTLGVRPNFADYTDDEKKRIRDTEKIYYPSSFYADLFDAMGKKTFPSYHTYKCVQDKIKQTALFNLLGIPHPRTRAFYGKRTYKTIKDCFEFPFVGKIPRGSAQGRGVFLIKDQKALDRYLDCTDVAYIQMFLPIDRDIRVVVVGQNAVVAYWRIAPSNEFRTNIALGGRVSMDSVPEEAVKLALYTAQKCGWDDVGIDIIYQNNQFYVIEGNMKYGREGFAAANIDYIKMMEKMIKHGAI
jgi:ribosomal protein S6--L-glutamate ligase